MGYSRQERQALCDDLQAAGPDAPTLCVGWTARDLAAHLVLRERRLDAGADAVLAASVFHFGEVRIAEVKSALRASGHVAR